MFDLTLLSNEDLLDKHDAKVRYDHYGWGEPEKDDWPTQEEFRKEITSRMRPDKVKRKPT